MTVEKGAKMEKEPVECHKCGRIYRADKLKQCPGCATSSPVAPLANQSANASVTQTESKKIASSSSRIAVESARIVNGYGTFIQVIGIIVGIIIILGGFSIASSAHSLVIAILGLVIGLLDLSFFAIQGAIFRMISNYVIARLE